MNLQDNDFINCPSYRLVINLGPMGKLVYLVSEPQLELFVEQYNMRGNIVFMNIDNEVLGLDSDTIFLWAAYSLGRSEIPLMKELGMYG